jgi:hypothetical protein
MRATRFKELCYVQIDRNLWRITDAQTGATIGPFYKTKAELLADLARYAKDYGCE